MSTKQNKALIRKFEDLINARELDTALTLFSPDFVDHTPAVGLPSGIEGVRAFFLMQFTAFPDNDRRSLDMIAEGDKSSIAWVARAPTRGCFWAFRRPPSESPGPVLTSGALRMGS